MIVWCTRKIRCSSMKRFKDLLKIITNHLHIIVTIFAVHFLVSLHLEIEGICFLFWGGGGKGVFRGKHIPSANSSTKPPTPVEGNRLLG